MKKIFIIAVLIFAGFAALFFGQTGTIEKMISAQQKLGGMPSGWLMDNNPAMNNHELSNYH